VAPDLVVNPGAFVLVGMAGFFTAVSSTPVSTIIFVSEMTNSYELLLPSLMVCFLCHLFSPNFSIYREQVKNRFESPAHSGELVVDILQAYKVRELMEQLRTACVVQEAMKFAEFKDLFCSTEHHYFPVVDQENRLTGIFSSTDFRGVLFAPEVEDLILVKDIAITDIIYTTPDEDLNTVMNKFTRKNIDSMPVVRSDDPGRLLGMLRRREVIDFYNNKIRQMKENRENEK